MENSRHPIAFKSLAKISEVHSHGWGPAGFGQAPGFHLRVTVTVTSPRRQRLSASGSPLERRQQLDGVPSTLSPFELSINMLHQLESGSECFRIRDVGNDPTVTKTALRDWIGQFNSVCGTSAVISPLPRKCLAHWNPTPR